MKLLVMDPTVSVNDRLVVKDIEERPDYLRDIVKGPIEFLTLKIEGNYYDFIMHEEGKYVGLPANIAVFNDGKVFDIIVGTVIIAKADDEGRTIGLTDEDISMIKRYFENNPKQMTRDGHFLLSYYYPMTL
jgi:hypothetical protein